VIEKHGPPRVIVNSNLEFSPGGGDSRASERKLLQTIDKEHGEVLRSAIRKAGKTKGRATAVQSSWMFLRRSGKIVVDSYKGTNFRVLFGRSESLPCPRHANPAVF
jgi:hypothetical protein